MFPLAQTQLTKKGGALTQYIKSIANSKPLSRAREAELAERIKTGDEAARRELASANLLFVLSIAQQYQDRGLTLAELISAGNVGLMTAVDRFDGARGTKFISYAVWWIRQAILEALMEEVHSVRPPESQVNLFRKVAAALKKLEHAKGTAQSIEDVSEELGVEVDKIEGAMPRGQLIYRLDEPIDSDEGSRNFIDTLADNSGLPVDERVLDEDMNGALEKLVGGLEERDRIIIKYYFGLTSEGFISLEEIGDIIGLTRERVRQLKERALRKLRDPALRDSVFGPRKVAAEQV